MESPVFKLEGIVKERDALADFEGPLSVILQLLSKDKIEIKDISVSSILSQYLEYLDKMAELDLDIASEFVAMASHLTYIKTKMLISGKDDISELDELISSLEQLRRGDLYLQIREAAHTLSNMYSRDTLMMAGPPEYLERDGAYQYVHISQELLQAMFKLVDRENLLISSLVGPKEPVYPSRVVYSISRKISDIIEYLKQNGETPVRDLLYSSSNKTEIIATLVAVLELCRVGSVLISGLDEDMTISYTGQGRESEIYDFTNEVYNGET